VGQDESDGAKKVRTGPARAGSGLQQTPRDHHPLDLVGAIAHYLDVSERHVRDIRREDETFPPPRMVGRKPRWSPDVIRRWVADGGGPTRPPAGPTGPKRKGPGRV
jgi:hypothetical protein